MTMTPKHMNTPIYPKLSIRKSERGFVIETITRLQDKKGIWYTCQHHHESWIGKRDKENDILSGLIMHTTMNIYLQQKLSIADPDLEVPATGAKVWSKDKDQRSEEQRLREDVI